MRSLIYKNEQYYLPTTEDILAAAEKCLKEG